MYVLNKRQGANFTKTNLVHKQQWLHNYSVAM